MIDEERRRTLRIIGAAGMTGLAGCTGGGGNNESSGNGEGDNPNAISWWNIDVQGTAKEAAAKLESMFEEQTGIQVEQTKYENTPYKPAVSNALGTDDAPDLFYIWPGPNRLGRYVRNGNVIPLDGALSKEQKNAQIPDAIRGAQYKKDEILSWRDNSGEMYSIPYDLAGIPIWYNKNVLSEAGVDPERLKHATDITWSEFLDICSKLSNAGYTAIECGNRNSWTIGHWVSAFMIKAAGVDHYYNAAFGLEGASLTDEPFQTALSRLKQLYDNGYFNQDINSLNNNEAAALFFSGQAGFWSQGTWVSEVISSQAPDDFAGIPDVMDYMWWPAFPDVYENSENERMSVVPNSTVAISSQAAKRGDEHLTKVKKFASFFGSLDAQKAFFEITGSPVTRTDVYDEVDMSPSQQTTTATVGQLQSADEVGMVFDVAFLPETTEALLSGGQELFTGTSPSKVLQNVQKTNQDALSNL
ncbi:ABC transporter substrate-binding protein [Halegenticoccus tardaugens]|uniref:ABC transporter substrate-binding protein n=1 Tax=Halegenticoccus tardaugens TaxID=2071624 RepID=UPI0013E955D6|nr:ABC transporter substrate-binding protein [Halegenticoccus tardaugens]